MTATLFDAYHWLRFFGLEGLQPEIRQPEIAREFGKITWTKAVNNKGFSIDLRGEWSPRQAFHVMEVVRPEAEAVGLMVVPVNITTHGGPARVMILVLCRRHNVPVSPNSVCSKCKEEFPV